MNILLFPHFIFTLPVWFLRKLCVFYIKSGLVDDVDYDYIDDQLSMICDHGSFYYEVFLYIILLTRLHKLYSIIEFK